MTLYLALLPQLLAVAVAAAQALAQVPGVLVAVAVLVKRGALATHQALHRLKAIMAVAALMLRQIMEWAVVVERQRLALMEVEAVAAMAALAQHRPFLAHLLLTLVVAAAALMQARAAAAQAAAVMLAALVQEPQELLILAVAVVAAAALQTPARQAAPVS